MCIRDRFSTGVFAAFEDFTDVKGHWAEETLRKAHDDSIIEGYNETTLAPNDSITTAQMITIICRVPVSYTHLSRQ